MRQLSQFLLMILVCGGAGGSAVIGCTADARATVAGHLQH